jgi:hypothetical protein
MEDHYSPMMHVYYMRIELTPKHVLKIKIFSDAINEEDLLFKYYDNLSDQQPDLTKYSVAHVGVFNTESKTLSLALKAYEYAEDYS